MKTKNEETLDQVVNRVLRGAKKAGKPYSKQEEINLRGGLREYCGLKNRRLEKISRRWREKIITNVKKKKGRVRPRFNYGSKTKPPALRSVNV